MGSILDRDEKLVREMRSGKGKLSPAAQLSADEWARKEPHLTSDALRQGLGWVERNAPDFLAEPIRRAKQRDAEGSSGLRFADDMLRELTPGSAIEVPLSAVAVGKVPAKVIGAGLAGVLGADEATAGPLGKLGKALRGGEKHELMRGLKAGEWVPERTYRDLVPDPAEAQANERLVASMRGSDQKTFPGMTKTAASPPDPLPRTERGGQAMLPGLERDKQSQRAQALADQQRLRGELEQKEAQLRGARNIRLEHRATLDRPALERIDEERLAPKEAAHDEAVERRARLGPLADREHGDLQLQQLAEARAGGSPDESMQEWLDRTIRTEGLKEDAPIETPLGRLTRPHGNHWQLEGGDRGQFSSFRTMPPEVQPAFRERQEQLHSTRELMRQLRDEIEGTTVAAPPLPGDLERLSTPPTTHPPEQPYGYPDRLERNALPANKAWWEAESGVPQSVRSFMDAARHEPSILQYGTMPQGARSLEDFAEEFGNRAKKPIYIDEKTGSNYYDYDEPYKIEVPKEHGRGEVMRDRHGDYKQEPKLHEPGDYPMHDERGDVKKIEAQGPVLEDEDPLMVKRRAEGGEPMRSGGSWGGEEKYRFIKSEGGEPMRDDRGHQKYTEEENPDYNPPDEDAVDEIVLSTDPSFRRNYINVSDPHGDNPTMGAMSAGDSGALLYQTYLAHAAKEGMEIGQEGLTSDNAFRMLSNTLANAIRTGVNPRDVTGTASGLRPRAEGYAKGEEIWRALAGEADARIKAKGGNPDAVQFTGSGFTIDGRPATTSEIFQGIDKLSPKFKDAPDDYGKGTKVGPKSVMQNAVYKWLENASPDEAREAAKNWGRNIGVPLAGLGGAALLADHLRGDNRQA